MVPTGSVADGAAGVSSERLIRLRTLYSGMQQFMGLLSPDGTVLEINPAALEAVGATLDEIEGVPFWETPWWVHSNELRHVLKDALRRAAAGEFVRFDATHLTVTKGMIHVDVTIKPIVGEDGKVQWLVPEGRDITDRIRVEEELREAKAEIEARVRERTAELALSNDLLRRKVAELDCEHEEREILEAQLLQAQKLESVGRLAGGVAHDFNNMLGVILGHAELALRTLEEGHPVRDDLDEICKAVLRSAEVTRQLLAFARKQTIAPKLVDLNRAVEGVTKMIRRLVGEDIELVWRPGEGLGRVKIDPAQIDQILANLATNARDAIVGTGKITIETSNELVDGPYCAIHPEFVPGAFVALSFSDDGCGIERGNLGRIFDPFYTTKEVGRGTGLGLSTVYGIARQNGGFVHVYSEPGHGTTFKIYLVRYDEPPAAVARRTEAELERGVETVLVVEDEQVNLKLVCRMLASFGYRVLAAERPEQALVLVEQNTGRIDLVITDVVMPGMNGRELSLKIAETQPGARCLYMSGYTANEIDRHGVLDEGVNYIQKPFSAAQLSVRVREALEGASMGDRRSEDEDLVVG